MEERDQATPHKETERVREPTPGNMPSQMVLLTSPRSQGSFLHSGRGGSTTTPSHLVTFESKDTTLQASDPG